jgi:3'-phosphoadenosine 5'-phosphosulfate sulfotransferase (PAPS reductase)/FAD synthetase
MKIYLNKEIERLLGDPGAIFYCSHSGGKDSQAMYAELLERVPRDRLVVVHADLGRIEWDGVKDHIRENIDHDLNVVQAGKTFFEMVRHRAKVRPDAPSWPSPKYRQCTSDLKTGPIMKFIRNDMKARPGAHTAVNAMGIRAEESSARAKKAPWKVNKKNTIAARAVFDWMPIFEWSTEEVFDRIYEAGQKPFHAYGARGEKNERLSCVFCIMGSDNDLRNGAIARPELYREYVLLEREVGNTMFTRGKDPLPLDEKIGIRIPMVEEKQLELL